MTMPRKGTRRIIVDGVAYRWRHRSRRSITEARSRPLTFAVEREDAPGRLLSVTLGDLPPLSHYCCTYCSPDEAMPEPITPSRVAASIRTALADGWDPRGPAGVHRLDMRPLIAAGV
ncbi:hypothetical protein [Nocardiopsis sp. CC223A]|uniref:hypothetical protein n=1 Tax=Nocardiopsis sp. CC223A TaxID=3044051 RepID=UPI00278BFF09|nr:hypothetical protein [Nocardiopsis sp. CC223A]